MQLLKGLVHFFCMPYKANDRKQDNKNKKQHIASREPKPESEPVPQAQAQAPKKVSWTELYYDPPNGNRFWCLR